MHVVAELGLRTVEQPQATEGIFNEVANNPVRREKLGDGGNVFRGHGALARHDLVFLLRDVELVKPAEQFDLGAIFIADLSAEAVNDGMFRQQIIRQEQLGFVVELFKNVGQQGVVEMAGRQNEAAINFTLRIRRGNPAIEEIIESLGIGVRLEFRRQCARARELEQFRLGFIGACRRQHPRPEWMPAASVHEPQRRQTVEPSIGHALDKPLAIGGFEFTQCCHLRRVGGQKIRRLGGEREVELARDRFHELAADGRSESFERGRVHESGMTLGFGSKHGGQESKVLGLFIQRPCLLEILQRLFEGTKRQVAIQIDQVP